MSKSPEMNQFLDKLSNILYKNSRLKCIEDKICVCCSKPAIKFRNKLSEKEFTISALCQECQDGTFWDGT